MQYEYDVEFTGKLLLTESYTLEEAYRLYVQSSNIWFISFEPYEQQAIVDTKKGKGKRAKNKISAKLDKRIRSRVKLRPKDEKAEVYGKLFVGFLSGSVYEYYEFPESLYERFMQAFSYGKFFWRWVRGRYDYKRIE